MRACQQCLPAQCSARADSIWIWLALAWNLLGPVSFSPGKEQHSLGAACFSVNNFGTSSRARASESRWQPQSVQRTHSNVTAAIVSSRLAAASHKRTKTVAAAAFAFLDSTEAEAQASNWRTEQRLADDGQQQRRAAAAAAAADPLQQSRSARADVYEHQQPATICCRWL